MIYLSDIKPSTEIDTSQLPDLSSYLQTIQSAVSAHTYEKQEGSPGLGDDTETLSLVQDMAKQMVSDELKYVIDIGIGGSNLGAKAVYDALHGYFDTLDPERTPRLLFADTNDPEYLSQLIRFLKQKVHKPQEIIINVISKSGGTTETITNAEVVLSALSHLDIKDRVVVTTEKTSPMGHAVEKRGFRFLPHPNVGGRYSILSTVGLFPLACVGVDIEALRSGAVAARENGLAGGVENSIALRSARTLFAHLLKGYIIHDTFFFHPELESLGKWYRQLTGESLGKEQDLDGKTVFAGMTPTVSVGSTDLHSMAQLYLGGPRNKITTFVSSAKSDSVRTPAEFVFDGLVSNITDRPIHEIMSAILEGTKVAYTKQKLPYMHIELDAIDEHSIGAFMQMRMIEMMLLARMMNINAFDQPHVEIYKKEVKRILAE